MQGSVIDCTGNSIQYVGGRSHQLPTLLLRFHLRDTTNEMPEEQDQSHSPTFTLSDAAKHQLFRRILGGVSGDVRSRKSGETSSFLKEQKRRKAAITVFPI